MRTPSGLIVLAFKGWVDHVKKDIRVEDENKRLSAEELNDALLVARQENRRVFVRDMGEAMYEQFMEGAVEAGFGLDPDAVKTLAFNYAKSIVDYSDQMTSEAAAEAYHGLLNRNRPPREAFGFMKRVFGVDRRAVRSLLKMFDRDQERNHTLKESSSKKQAMMDRYIASSLNTRAALIGEEEAYGAKETAKALIWNLAAHQGKFPETARKRWITARDELVCKVCGPMNNVTVGMNEKFITPKGESWAPHMHPHCRCKAVMVINVKRPRQGSAFDRVRKSDDGYNPYRRKDGTFAPKNENTWAPGFKPASRPQVAPVRSVSAVGRVRPVALLERPQKPPQTSVNARFDQLITNMYAMPQVESHPSPVDLDVEWALEQSRNTPSKITTISTINAIPAPRLKELTTLSVSNPVIKPLTVSRPSISELVIAAPSLNAAIDIQINQPSVEPVAEVDVKATIQQQIIQATDLSEEVKTELIEETEKPDAVYNVAPFYGVHSTRFTNEAVPHEIVAGMTLFSTESEVVSNFYGEMESVSGEIFDSLDEAHRGKFSYYDDNGKKVTLDKDQMWDIVEQYGRKIAGDQLTGYGFSPDDDYEDDPYGEETLGFNLRRVERQFELTEYFEDADIPTIYSLDSIHEENIITKATRDGVVYLEVTKPFRTSANTNERVYKLEPEWSENYVPDDEDYADMEMLDSYDGLSHDDDDPSWYQDEWN